MKRSNLNAFKNDFMQLWSKDRLKLLEIITEVMKEKTEIDSVQEEQKKVAEVLEHFEVLLETIRQEEKDQGKIKALENFTTLSKEHQREIIDEIVFYCKIYSEEEREARRKRKREEKIRLCAEKGHKFSEWKETTEYKSQPVFLLGNPRLGKVGETLREVQCWERKCSYCKLVEKAFDKPDEVVLAEKEKEVAELRKKIEQK